MCLNTPRIDNKSPSAQRIFVVLFPVKIITTSSSASEQRIIYVRHNRAGGGKGKDLKVIKSSVRGINWVKKRFGDVCTGNFFEFLKFLNLCKNLIFLMIFFAFKIKLLSNLSLIYAWLSKYPINSPPHSTNSHVNIFPAHLNCHRLISFYHSTIE